MKIVAVTHSAGRFSTRLYADSALARDVMPLFLPDTPAVWHGLVCVALRVGRLGKSVAPGFAMRYVDAYTAVCVQAADTAEIDTSLMDQAVMAGRWLDIAALGPQVRIQVDGFAAAYDTAELDIPSVVAHLTRYATIKTGDIIILSDTAVAVPLAVPSRLTAAIDGEECLTMKIR